MSEGSKEERDPIRYLGYAPSAREPDLSNIVPSVDNRNPRYLERRKSLREEKEAQRSRVNCSKYPR